MHLEILAYGSPEQHKRVVKQINSWKYEIEGKTFKGEMAPFISEIKLYDIRIPEELAPQFMRDIGVIDFQLPTNLNWKSKLIKKIMDFGLKMLGSKKLELPKKKKYTTDGYFQCFSLGNFKDNLVTEPFTGDKKEVL